MKQSNFLSLNWRDLLHAFILIVIAAIVNFLQEILVPALNISPEIKSFLLLGIAYLSKKLFEKPDAPKIKTYGDGAGTPEEGL